MIATVAITADIILGGIAAAQNAQLIEVIIPIKYLTPSWLLGGFGVGLLFVYFAARATHPAPAEVRLKYAGAGDYPIEITNVGESEANEVKIAPIEFDTYPWKAEFDEVGSVPAGPMPELPRVKVKKRDTDGLCERCDGGGKPATFEQFLLELGEHLQHRIQRDHLTASSAERPLHHMEGIRFARALLYLHRGAFLRWTRDGNGAP